VPRAGCRRAGPWRRRSGPRVKSSEFQDVTAAPRPRSSDGAEARNEGRIPARRSVRRRRRRPRLVARAAEAASIRRSGVNASSGPRRSGRSAQSLRA